jgi:DNA-binding response OmpR family regulator
VLYVVHDAPLALPPRLQGQTRYVTDRLALAALGEGDVVLWGQAPELLHLQGLPPGDSLLSPSLSCVQAARRAAWDRAVLLPSLEPEILERALDERLPLLALDEATLVPEAGVLWREGQISPLVGQERRLLEQLVAAQGAFVSSQALREGLAASEDAVQAVVNRLRRKLGARHLPGERGRGWRLLGEPLPVQLQPWQGPVVRRLSDLELDGASRQLRVGERELALSAHEAGLLELLLDAGGRVVPREDALHRLDLPSREALDTLVHRVRSKIGAERLQTVRGRGYRLRACAPAPPDPACWDAAAVAELLGAHSLVSITGPAGAGKSRLLSAVAERLRVPVFDVRDIELERAMRWASRRRDGLVLLDGFLNASAHQEALSGLLDSGKRVLLGAGEPAGLPQEQVISLQAPPPLQVEQVRQVLRSRPQELAALTALSCFVGPFGAQDMSALAPGLDPEDAHRRGLLARSGPRHTLAPAVREALPEPGTRDRDRWAERVVGAMDAAYQAIPCPIEEVIARGPELEAALDHLVARRLPLAVPAASLWLTLGRWWGSKLASSRVAPLLELPLLPAQRARLLVELADADDLDMRASLALVEQALALPCEADTRWRARTMRLVRLWDREAGEAPLRELMELADQPCDPAPADMRVLLDLIGSRQPRFGPRERKELLIEALARLERSRWSSTLPEIFLADARAALLADLAGVALRLEELELAERALADADKVATPRGAGLVGEWRAKVWARQGRWAEADSLLDQLTWQPVHRHFPIAQARLLELRAHLAVRHGQAALALSLVEQVEWLGEKMALSFALRAGKRLRTWLAAAEGREDEAEALASQAYRPDEPLGGALVALARLVAQVLPEEEAQQRLAPALRGLDEEKRRELERLMQRACRYRSSA